jgi:hypothetical protein
VFVKQAFIARLVSMILERELVVHPDITVPKPLYHHNRASQELSATHLDFLYPLIARHAQVA